MVVILFVHGGTTWPDHASLLSYVRGRTVRLEDEQKWKDTLARLPARLVMPRMPCKENAHYDAWAIWFGRHLALFEDVVLLGESLGAGFLARYLAENDVACRVRGVFLVAPPFDDSLPGEPLVNGFDLSRVSDFSRLDAYGPALFFSKNDTIVPLDQAERFREKLPSARILVLDAADHFQQPELPEVLDAIRSVL